MAGADKLRVPVAGRPLLAWTLAALAAAQEVDHIALAVPSDRIAEVAAADWLPTAVRAVVAGGERRQESVAAGIAALEHSEADEGRIVLVHDAARPMVSPDLVRRVALAADRFGAAIPVVPVVDTLKWIQDDQVAGTLDRARIGAAQTPQGARLGLLRTAFARFPAAADRTFTDEAALLEACTIPVHVVPGDPRNTKVTVPDDLDRARRALAPDARPGVGTRVGFGHDSHSFGPGGPLRLGGIELADAPRLVGHSDGDVALHAVADALLGAAALGDLGRHFPATSETPAGAASTDLLGTIRERVADAGYRPVAVDVTIVAGRPRLGSRLDDMRAAVADVLGLGRDAVNVKASSGNLIGPEGAGRTISAHAVAVLEAGP